MFEKQDVRGVQPIAPVSLSLYSPLCFFSSCSQAVHLQLSSVAFAHTTGTSHLHFCCVHHALPPLNMHKGCYNTSVTHLTRNSKLHSPFFKLLSRCVPTNLRFFSLLNQPFPSLCIGHRRCSGHERSHHQNSLSLIRLPFPPLL